MTVIVMFLLIHAHDLNSLKYEAAMAACTGDPDHAGAIYYKVFTGSMNSKDAAAAGLLILKLKGNYTKALIMCSSSSKSNRSDVLHYWCGRIYWELKQYKYAYEHFKTAISLGGDRPWYLAAYSVSSAKLKKRKEAVTAMKKLLKISPWLLDSWLWPSEPMGVVLFTEDLFNGLNEGTKLASLAALGIACKSYDYALLKGLEAWKSGNRSPLLYEVLIKAYAAAYDTGASERYLSLGLNSYPSNVGLRLILAKKYYYEKKWGKAISEFLKVLPSLPGSIEVLTLLGISYYKAGKKSQARQYLEYALERGGNSPSLLYFMARLEKESGESGKAEALLRKCITDHIGAVDCAADLAVYDKKLKKIYDNYLKLREKIKKEENQIKEIFLKLKTFLLSNKKCPKQTKFVCTIIKTSKKFSEARVWRILKKLNKINMLRRVGINRYEKIIGKYGYKKVFFNGLPIFIGIK